MRRLSSFPSTAQELNSSTAFLRAHPLLAPFPVRRFFALLAFLLVLALAATLLYRVYLHHEAAEPYEEADSVSVELRVKTTLGFA